MEPTNTRLRPEYSLSVVDTVLNQRLDEGARLLSRPFEWVPTNSLSSRPPPPPRKYSLSTSSYGGSTIPIPASEHDRIAAVRWHGDNIALLWRWFTTDEPVKQYLWVSDIALVNLIPDLNPVADVTRPLIEVRIQQLDLLRQRLPVYESPGTSRVQVTSVQPRHSVVNQIFNGGTFGAIYAYSESVKHLENTSNTVGSTGQAVLDEPDLRDPEHRRQGRIMGAIRMISATAAVGTKLHEVWTAWEPTIKQLLNRH